MNSPSTNSIETVYSGIRFRSRLEARWAIVFDALDIPWLYEPEGFTVHLLDRDVGYLPDFYLPRSGTWVEVKGSTAQLYADAEKLAWACDWTPIPGVHESHGAEGKGLLVLGPVQAVDDRQPVHPIVQHHEGMWAQAARLDPGFGAMTDLDGDQLDWFTRDNYADASTGDWLLFGPSRQRIDIDVPFIIDKKVERWVANAYNSARSHRFWR